MTGARRTAIDLVYFNAGGGHRASAEALRAVASLQRRAWDVRLVNLMQVLDPQETFRRTTGMAPEDYYNKRLKHGWTLGLAQELKLLQGMIRLGHERLVSRLQVHWLRSDPDLVVSLIPNFNRAMIDSLKAALPGVPYATVLTDLADTPPRFWIEPVQAGIVQHLVCGTTRAVSQAQALGHASECIHATSGMVLRPSFYDLPPVDRPARMVAMGLDPKRSTGIVMFGGHGSRAMITIAERLPDIQLIFACGHNDTLARRLRALPARAPRCVIGYTDRIVDTMRLADYFIGKPGPGSLSEALHLSLPVLVTRNAWTMPQERYNTDWVSENDVGVVHGSHRTIDVAVGRLLARLDELRKNVRRLDNRAVFELPDIFADILQRSASASSPRRSAWMSTPLPTIA